MISKINRLAIASDNNAPLAECSAAFSMRNSVKARRGRAAVGQGYVGRNAPARPLPGRVVFAAQLDDCESGFERLRPTRTAAGSI